MGLWFQISFRGIDTYICIWRVLRIRGVSFLSHHSLYNAVIVHRNNFIFHLGTYFIYGLLNNDSVSNLDSVK
jgi:hypothetical protein